VLVLPLLRAEVDMSRYQGSRVPATDDHDTYTRQQLLEAIDEYRRLFLKLRECEDPRCSLCAHCHHVVFRESRPAPTRIPDKYHYRTPWRRA
jgi:hypothetical protein